MERSTGDEYLLRLSRYVHQNPVWVGAWAKKPLKERLEHLERYPWSSYPSYIGRAKPLEFVDYGPILNMMVGASGAGRRAYRNYVDSGLAEGDAEFKEALKASPCSIGDENFQLWVERLRAQAMGRRRRKEDVAFRRVVEPLAPERVLAELSRVFSVQPEALCQRRRDSTLRAVAARCLLRYSGQTQREAAERLGLRTGAAVSAQVKRLPEVLAGNRSLRRLVGRAERALEQLRQQKQEAPKRPKLC